MVSGGCAHFEGACSEKNPRWQDRKDTEAQRRSYPSKSVQLRRFARCSRLVPGGTPKDRPKEELAGSSFLLAFSIVNDEAHLSLPNLHPFRSEESANSKSYARLGRFRISISSNAGSGPFGSAPEVNCSINDRSSDNASRNGPGRRVILTRVGVQTNEEVAAAFPQYDRRHTGVMRLVNVLPKIET